MAFSIQKKYVYEGGGCTDRILKTKVQGCNEIEILGAHVMDYYDNDNDNEFIFQFTLYTYNTKYNI